MESCVSLQPKKNRFASCFESVKYIGSGSDLREIERLANAPAIKFKRLNSDSVVVE